jgi:hypothetical protein
MVYFPLIRRGLHRKFFVAAGWSLPSCYLATIADKQTDIQTHMSNNYVIVACILCRWNVYNQPLPSNKSRDTIYLAIV